MLEKTSKLGINSNEVGRLGLLKSYLAKVVSDRISGTRNLVKKVVPVLAIPAGILLSGTSAGCTLSSMGEAVPKDSDANFEDTGSVDVLSDGVFPDRNNSDADGGILNETSDVATDSDGGDAIAEDAVREADVLEDVVQESDGQVVDAPADVPTDATGDTTGDVINDVVPGVGAVVWSNDMDGYTVMHIRAGNPMPNSSSPDVNACQQKPFTSLGVEVNDYIELLVKKNTANDGGACAVDGGEGLDCENIAAAIFTPVNIIPLFVEGRCSKYVFDCTNWSGIIPEINDAAGYITLAADKSGGVWKYSVPQSCISKVYKLHY
jgi:hypothetical protein